MSNYSVTSILELIISSDFGSGRRSDIMGFEIGMDKSTKLFEFSFRHVC